MVQGKDLVGSAIKDCGAVPEGYEEIQADFIKFENEGDRVAGTLQSKTKTRVRGNEVFRYTMLLQKVGEASRKRVAFLGGVDLDEKLSTVMGGTDVVIEFVSREKQDDTGNEIKRFRVFRRKSS